MPVVLGGVSCKPEVVVGVSAGVYSTKMQPCISPWFRKLLAVYAVFVASVMMCTMMYGPIAGRFPCIPGLLLGR